MESKGFGAGLEFLPTQMDKEETLLEVWEMIDPSQRKNFEADLKAKDPVAFQHFHDNVLVNHPEYKD